MQIHQDCYCQTHLCFQPCISLFLLLPLLPQILSTFTSQYVSAHVKPLLPSTPGSRSNCWLTHAGICSTTSQWTPYSSHLETLRGSHWLAGNSGCSSLWGQGDKVASQKIQVRISVGCGAFMTAVGDSSGDQDKDFCFDLVFRLLATRKVSSNLEIINTENSRPQAVRWDWRGKKISTGITTAEQIWGNVYGSELRIKNLEKKKKKNLDTLATWRPSSLKQNELTHK